MWNHPITQTHLKTLSYWGWSSISPVSKLLACKDTGNGALADVDTIVETVKDSIASILQSKSNVFKASEFDIFNFLETCGHKMSIEDSDKDTRKQFVSYHTLFCITINTLLFIGGLTWGESSSVSTFKWTYSFFCCLCKCVLSFGEYRLVIYFVSNLPLTLTLIPALVGHWTLDCSLIALGEVCRITTFIICCHVGGLTEPTVMNISNYS